MAACKVCGDETTNVFNIDFKPVPICEGCAVAIFMQQAIWYSKQKFPKPRKLKTIGVIAYNLDDFKLWGKAKKHNPKQYNETFRVYTYRGNRYIGLTRPEHTCGYVFDKIIETGNMASLNKLYHSILESAKAGLKSNGKIKRQN